MTTIDSFGINVDDDLEIINNHKVDRNSERMERMRHVISKFASTLCLRPIQVHIHDDTRNVNNPSPAPAWSDADNIWFGSKHIGDLLDSKVVRALRGLTIHEISHILLTPRSGSLLVTWVRSESLWRAFNALEDQRIETMMCTKFSSISDWLTSAIAQHLLDKSKSYPVTFPITWGRKYLPLNVRQALASSYSDQPNVLRISQLIDEYILINMADPNGVTRAKDIIKEYDTLVNELTEAHPHYPELVIKGWANIEDPNGHDHRKDGELKSSGTSKPMSKADQQRILDKLRQSMGAEQPYEDSGTEDNSEQLDSDSQTGQGDVTSTTPEVGGSGSQADALDDSITELLDKTLQKASAKVERTVQETIKQFNGEAELNNTKVKEPDKANVWHKDVSTEAVQGAKAFGSELFLLKADHDPGWNRKQDTGSLNVQRYAMGCDVDEAFDLWDIGREDVTDIECVVLLDVSPSMNWTIAQAYENMWAIKRALDKINASTTVVLFDESARILYKSDERASHRLRHAHTGGGTDPFEALKYTRYLLSQSNRAIKLVITITDGEWFDGGENDRILQQFNAAGVITALAYVDDTEYWNNRYKDANPNWQREGVKSINGHNCQVVTKVNNGNELFDLARKIVKVGIRRQLAE